MRRAKTNMRRTTEEETTYSNGYKVIHDTEIGNTNEPIYTIGDIVDVEKKTEISKGLKIEAVTHIVSIEKTWNIYMYIIKDEAYSESQLRHSEVKSQEITSEIDPNQKRYVWDILSSMRDGEIFDLMKSEIPIGSFVEIVGIVQRGGHLWPKDVSMTNDMAGVRIVGW